MGASNGSRLPINRPTAFWGGGLVSAMGIGLTALSVWALWVNHRDYAEAIRAGVPILLACPDRLYGACFIWYVWDRCCDSR